MRKFMRTRAASPPPPPPPPPLTKTNGVTNGVGSGPRRDDHSTLTRYWDEPEDAELWEDPDFPAAPASLGDRRLAQRTVWLRPHEMCARPRFLGDTALDAGLPPARLEPEPDDQFALRWSVEEGALGGAALGCAAAALALTPRLLARAAPPHSFRAGYRGRFTFRFWVFGAWRDVAVDDRLPARARRPLGAACALPDDFTLPLLEKAYAKLHGSYAALRSGSVARALQELSGGVVQSFAPPRPPRAALLHVLRAALPRASLLLATCARARAGLAPRAPYAVTGLARVRAPADAVLVRLRAPAARALWAGAWARGSAQWRALPEPDRDLLARRAAEPGHFWMSFDDFAQSFEWLDLVHVGPDDWLMEPALHGKRPWRAVLARRRWRRGYNAGGPPRCATAHTNPQFHVAVPGDARCHVVVSVTQEYAVGGAGGAGGARLLGIGFAVYELPPGAAPRRAALAAVAPAPLRALDVTHESRAREVATFFTLPPGQYLVVPYAARADLEAAFLLRIFTDEHTDGGERRQRDHPRRGGGGAGGRGGRGGRGGAAGGARGGGARRRAGRARAAGAAAARVAARAAGAAVAGAVPRAGGAARPRRERARGGARAAGAGGARGAVARGAGRGRGRGLRARRERVPAARAAVGERRHGLQQGAGVPGAALRARRHARARRLHAGARAAAPRARALPQPRGEAEVQPSLAGRDDPDDYLLVTRRRCTLLVIYESINYHKNIVIYIYRVINICDQRIEVPTRRVTSV